jgi:hypothetical protein
MDINQKANAVRDISQLTEAWVGHMDFARWIVKRMQPTTIVDLGVDFGLSTFALALENIGTVYGVDWFQGDAHAGFRDSYESVVNFKNYYQFDNVNIIKADFNELAKRWNLPIDILHIDGFHTYEAVKKDYETWVPFVREGGLIMFHDTVAFEDDVGLFLTEINLPRANFLHSAGLGIVSTDADLIKEICTEYGIPFDGE